MNHRIIEQIRKEKTGFVIINDKKIIYYDSRNFLKDTLGEIRFDDFISLATDLSGILIDRIILNDNSAILIFGNLNHIREECDILSQMFEMASLKIDDDLISSTIGIPYNHEQKEKSSLSYDFTNWIKEKTKRFVGRQNIITQIDDFIAKNPRGYITISAKPGIGKTAFAAKLIEQRNYIHHFNIRAQGITKTHQFLQNVCEQLISRYGLDGKYPSLPAEATQNSNFLSQLLDTISKTISDKEKIVIVIDGLDEVDDTQISAGANTLYLPTTLPPKAYVISTMRQGTNVSLQTSCESKTIKIEPYSKYNKADITEYLKNEAKNQKIQNFISSQNISEEFFIDHIFAKSEGNFMYLRCVMPDIEHGIYNDLGFEKIPNGLLQYYEQHWQIMKGRDEKSWFEYKLPVLVALTVTKKPISSELISTFSKVEKTARVHDVLEEWRQFLYEETAKIEGQTHTRYRLFHDTFHDFIASKDQVAAERVDLAKTEKQIIDSLLPEDYGI